MKLFDRLPFTPGTVPGILAAFLTLFFAEFVRSGVYGSYLQQAATGLLDMPKQDAVAVALTAFSVHFISDTVMRGPAGIMLDRYGVRRVMLGGAALSLGAMCLLLVAHQPWIIWLMAMLHGIGFSPMWPGVMNLTADAAKENYQGRALTLVSTSVMPAIGAGTLILGAIADPNKKILFDLSANNVIFIIILVQTFSALASIFVPKYRFYATNRHQAASLRVDKEKIDQIVATELHSNPQTDTLKTDTLETDTPKITTLFKLENRARLKLVAKAWPRFFRLHLCKP